MKTKIIYISGGEIFDMNDIRSAFDQVRGALSLGDDTVLFGVPVDRTDALADTISEPTIDTIEISMDSEQEPVPVAPVIAESSVDTPEQTVATDIPETTVTPVIDTIEPAIIETQTDIAEDATPNEPVEPIAEKKPRGRPKSVKKKVIEETPVVETPEPVTISEDIPHVASILSVLTSKPDTDVNTPVSDDVSESVPEIVDTLASEQQPVIEDELLDDAPVENPDIDINIDDDAIEDMVVESAPAVATEKTLEQLLESMAPLREDIEHDVMSEDTPAPDFDAFDSDINDDQISPESADTDATLEQLATEFAENQDKIATAPKTENHGKIGKLKNILPFKKARRDDSGLMGDLFGWAGVAANDEDFAIPGFFTNAASKK